MSKLFVAGSLSIKHLHPKFLERLDNAIKSGLEIVVGDASGSDASIQRFLADRGVKNVVVYCSGATPRNNLGDWSVECVKSDAAEGTRAFYTAKDRRMAEAADFGLMVWDTKSTGTLNNVIELIRGGKKSVVFINKEKRFAMISEPQEIAELIKAMSPTAKDKAERKIGLSKALNSLTNEQFSLQL
ncbi:hypothetical protein FDP25_10305 [Roseovarius sp. A21]|uniref:Uncharacterized protein n=1 Tax=Roseovarius bejariae TaxID=2576383 RepID=A0A844D3J0_9RHOB|nr:hypothetical protein [Roseovarius bejariae]MRU15818.1 hypothetical protein [Roseovarius bejariae]